MVAHGCDDPPPEPVRAARAQVAASGFEEPAPSELQRLTEGLVYQFMFLYADYAEARAAADRDRLAGLAAVARQTAAKLGFPVDGVQLAAAGFVPA
ncbi:MAG: hypothetical protein ACJ8J0_21605 [Longimicrobiaceae bacterium]